MKTTNFFRKMLSAMAAILFVLTATAEERNITVTAGGELASAYGGDALATVTSLTLSGPLNGDDITLLRTLATDHELTVLNLSAAVITGEGSFKYGSSSYAIRANTVRANMLSPLPKLQKLTLPTSLTTIEDYAFSYNEVLTTLISPALLTSCGYYAFIRSPPSSMGSSATTRL